MRLPRYTFLMMILLGFLALTSVFILWPVPQASAQCGSQASSCKNCHEVQGQDPVNNDGTGWHQSHAFGDFCYICHSGNSQATDKVQAHTGMVPPLSDVKAACQSCHANDLMARAKVYATALGVEVGTGNGTPGTGGTSGGGTATTGETAPTQPAATAAPAEVVVNEADVVDYNLRYEGKTPVNWGNIILIVMIVLVAGVGGAFAFWNERRLRGLPLWTKGEGRMPEAPVTSMPKVEGYSDEVVTLLPMIAQLNPVGLHALKRLLKNPEQANDLLASLSRLDPELVRRIRALDHDTRALLIALAGD